MGAARTYWDKRLNRSVPDASVPPSFVEEATCPKLGTYVVVRDDDHGRHTYVDAATGGWTYDMDEARKLTKREANDDAVALKKRYSDVYVLPV